jgi:hypothetical protein
MPRHVMTRRASDNRYLHKDFHGALSLAIDYLDRNYGEEAVRSYLRQFTRCYYSELKESIAERGLVALAEHFAGVYGIEGGSASIRLSESGDELSIEVDECPAVAHMRRRGFKIARLFVETTRTVNAALCEGTPFEYDLLEYDPETGRSRERFSRKAGGAS